MTNLGYPLLGAWGLTVVIRHDKAGHPKTIPVAFSPKQAQEIARRIIAYYGLPPEEFPKDDTGGDHSDDPPGHLRPSDISLD